MPETTDSDPGTGTDAGDTAGTRDHFLDFWTERHLCTLVTRRPDGTLHQVPVGATYDAERRVARIITDGASRKVRNVEADTSGLGVSLCQFDVGRWSTLEGVAVVDRDPDAVAEAVRRYTARYRPPRVNPNRVVIEIRIARHLGTVRPASTDASSA